MQFINQNSLILFPAVIIAAAAWYLLRAGVKRSDIIILALLVGAGGVFYTQGHLSAEAVEQQGQFEAQFDSGLPVLLEIRSPNCLGCIAAEPALEAVETEFQDRLVVVRVDIQSPLGKQLSRQYGTQYTPTFILFNAQAEEVWRSIGSLDEAIIRQQIQSLSPEA